MKQFLDLGLQPVANGFLTEGQIKDEKFYPLEVGYDEETQLISLMDVVDKRTLFNDKYPFITGQSQGMITHFKDTARTFQLDKLADSHSLVVEIGCNDGSFLRNFKHQVGIEPCGNIAQLARDNGIDNVYNKFLSRELMDDILVAHGRPKLVFAANTICHIEDINMVFETISDALRDDGWFVFEDPHWLDILTQVSYDQIYDEHVHYFCAQSVFKLAKKHGMYLDHTENLSVHGGEVRYYIRKGTSPDYMAKSPAYGFDDCELFARRVEESRDKLLTALDNTGKIWAYGATSKSTVIYNYCGIGPDQLEYITDTTPNKIGLLSPGTHIPIIDPTSREHGSTAFLAAWNHRKEIESKETNWINDGGKYITHI